LDGAGWAAGGHGDFDPELLAGFQGEWTDPCGDEEEEGEGLLELVAEEEPSCGCAESPEEDGGGPVLIHVEDLPTRAIAAPAETVPMACMAVAKPGKRSRVRRPSLWKKTSMERTMIIRTRGETFSQ
jgi:hypothetical protein